MSTDSTPLPRRRFGHSELEVTPLCIGGTTRADPKNTGAYPAPEDRHQATFRAVFNSPINFLDTAANYGDGESERRIGVVLRELGGLPDGFVVATKADRHPQSGDFSADQTQRDTRGSCQRGGRKPASARITRPCAEQQQRRNSRERDLCHWTRYAALHGRQQVKRRRKQGHSQQARRQRRCNQRRARVRTGQR